MTCGCGQTKGAIACRNGMKRDGQTVTRAVICAACPNMRQTGEHADAGICTRSRQPIDEHTVYALPCPEGRHPDAKGLVSTPITIGRLNIRVQTHGAPMWQRLELWSKGGISTVRAPKVPGCGCIVRAKRAVRVAWWAATNLDRWLRVCNRRVKARSQTRSRAQTDAPMMTRPTISPNTASANSVTQPSPFRGS